MPNPENLIGKGFDFRPENITPGRPKGSRNRSTIIKEWLEKVHADDGEPGDKADQLARALIRKAASGDVSAIKEAFDSAYGKVPDKVLQAETTPEELHRDVTDDVLKKLPTEELEKILESSVTNGVENRNDNM